MRLSTVENGDKPVQTQSQSQGRKAMKDFFKPTARAFVLLAWIALAWIIAGVLTDMFHFWF